MSEPTPEVYAAAMNAAFPGLPPQMDLDEAQRRVDRAVDAVWPLVEREIRAKVAAEIRDEAQELRRLAKDAKDRRDDGDPDAARHLDRFLAKAVALEQVAGRIAEGGDTNG